MQTNGLLGFWRGMSKWQRACTLSNVPLFALYCLCHPAPAPPSPPPLLPPMAATSPPAPPPPPPTFAVMETPLRLSDPFRRPLSRTGGADERRAPSRPGYRAPEPLPGNPEVVLPLALLREGFDDTVDLRAYIDAKGSVQGVRVLRSSGNNAVDVAAADTVRRWRYRPAQRNGRPVAAVEEMTLSVGDTFGE